MRVKGPEDLGKIRERGKSFYPRGVIGGLGTPRGELLNLIADAKYIFLTTDDSHFIRSLNQVFK